MTNHPPPDPFWTFEHTAWERSARSYHNFWTRLTSQTIEPLLSAIQRGDTTRLLDVATGSGNVAQAGIRKGMRVVGVDFSTAMLTQARKQYQEIDFCEGDAEVLPFSDNNFDAVVINFGLLHFGNPEQALKEAYRVLRSGGRIGFTVWATPDAAIGFQIMLQAIETHGDPAIQLPEGPPFFRFSDPAESERTLQAIGFTNLSITAVQQIWRLPSPNDLFVAFYEGTARTGGLLRAQSRVALDNIRTAVIKAASAYEKDGSVKISMPAILTSAQKP
ncbi:SAM-dependent methyltransferase [Candidatus Poribacteria bacterium]|nr:MAG: SAM-dependent methyltransferase [Candidatus Poribacteria bacterium]